LQIASVNEDSEGKEAENKLLTFEKAIAGVTLDIKGNR